MAGPTWAGWAFALLFALVGLWFVVRLRVAWQADGRIRWSLDAHHVLMAAGMTVMFLPSGHQFLPPVVALLFVADAGWLAVQAARRDPEVVRPGSHLLANLAMIYMLLAQPSHAGGGAAHQAAWPAIGWLLVAFLLGFAVWDGLRMTAPAAVTRTEGARRIGGSLHVFMGVGMSYMLLAMV